MDVQLARLPRLDAPLVAEKLENLLARSALARARRALLPAAASERGWAEIDRLRGAVEVCRQIELGPPADAVGDARPAHAHSTRQA